MAMGEAKRVELLKAANAALDRTKKFADAREPWEAFFELRTATQAIADVLVGVDWDKVRQAEAAERDVVYPRGLGDSTNRFAVGLGAGSNRVHIMAIHKFMNGLTEDEAVNLAAYLVALADPGLAKFKPVFEAVMAT